MRLIIVGGATGTDVARSLLLAAPSRGLQAFFVDQSRAMQAPWFIRQICWRLLGRRPPLLKRFSEGVVVEALARGAHVLVCTGASPLISNDLVRLSSLGIRTVNFSTDDPWNNAHRAQWYLDALPYYTKVFTPRRSNIADFLKLGCADVRYLPFGYDDYLLSELVSQDFAGLVIGGALFVGGADKDRAAFFSDFLSYGVPLTLVGAYWNRFPKVKACSLGHKAPAEVVRLTKVTAVNICLVRRANRDGHVMRTYEIAAIGGFMIVEDTAEHRQIFGREGDCVLYFSTPEEAASKARWALGVPDERKRMAAQAMALIRRSGNSYGDRLEYMVSQDDA